MNWKSVSLRKIQSLLIVFLFLAYLYYPNKDFGTLTWQLTLSQFLQEV